MKVNIDFTGQKGISIWVIMGIRLSAFSAVPCAWGWGRQGNLQKTHEAQVFQSITRSYPRTYDHKKILYYPGLLLVNFPLPELLFKPCILGDNHAVKAQQNKLMPVS